jgi:glycine dehydrogenase subunit 2
VSATIFEKSQEKQRAYSLPKDNAAWQNYFPPTSLLRKTPLNLPEVSELDLTRHFVGLSHRNVGIDNLFYPLGSCTMKFNPRINEWCASLPIFAKIHPLAPDELVQGTLRIIFELLSFLCPLTGMQAGSLAPNAGAQGELVGIQMIAAYHRQQGNVHKNEYLIPDSAHGTNPASVRMAGFKVKTIASDKSGDIDLEDLKKNLSASTAGLLLTNPNTLGLFSAKVLQITNLVHQAGGLLYYDGANLNPIMTIAKPGEMGFDVMHLNLHKTFSTPHGGGGPGSGPVLSNEKLAPFLPTPYVVENNGKFQRIWESPSSIGRIATFQGNFGIYLRALCYLKCNGWFGLRKAAENAVLNANYVKARLRDVLHIPFENHCMHEFVAQADRLNAREVRALDIAKRLLDYGFYAPTIYFPLILKEVMLIEPTETESKKTLDAFIDALKKIVEEANSDPKKLLEAPHTLPVKRLDEAMAARKPHVVSSKRS